MFYTSQNFHPRVENDRSNLVSVIKGTIEKTGLKPGRIYQYLNKKWNIITPTGKFNTPSDKEIKALNNWAISKPDDKDTIKKEKPSSKANQKEKSAFLTIRKRISC